MLENAHRRYTISAEGKNLAFVDRATGVDYLKRAAPSVCALARCQGAFGAVADRYIIVDFTGRRQFTLVETESARWNDYVWNDGKGLYNVYRETIDFGKVESVSIWYNNLPEGRQTRCVIGPVKALPMVACRVKNPALTMNGRTVVFPVEMPSGSYLEVGTNNDCVLYGPKGEVLANVSPEGPIPLLSAGENQIRFSFAATPGPAPRVRLTVTSYGQPLIRPEVSPPEVKE